MTHLLEAKKTSIDTVEAAQCDHGFCYHLLYMIKFTKSQLTLHLHHVFINAFAYCYNSLNVISLAQSKSDHTKRRPLYNVFF
jgi:hypothetical protein